MLRSGSAAAAHQRHAYADKLLRVIRHIFGRAQIDVPSLNVARHAGVGLRRKRSRRHRANPLHGVEHGNRADAAIAADDVGAPLLQLRAVVLGAGAIEAVAVFIDGHLRHDRQLWIDLARGEQGLVQLLQIAEGFQNEQVDALFVEGLDLFAEGVARFGEGDLAQRLDAHTERPHCACHESVEALGRLASDASAHAVDVSQTIQTSVLSQAKRIGAKSVCLYDLCPGLEIVVMDVADQVRLREVQLVVTTVDEDALGIQKRAHGAVAKHRTTL